MGTRSAIIMQQEDGKYRGIYCHWDGYPDHNGSILVNHYKDPNKVKELLDLGDISSLQPNISTTEEHTFDKPQKDVVIAYHRDRGEEKNEAIIKSSWKLVAKEIDQEYAYVYKNGEWHCYDGDELIDLSKYINVRVA